MHRLLNCSVAICPSAAALQRQWVHDAAVISAQASLIPGDIAILTTPKPVCALQASPWFIDQSIAGAVATGSHGASLRHGSISAQVSRATSVRDCHRFTIVYAPFNPRLYQYDAVEISAHWCYQCGHAAYRMLLQPQVFCYC